MLKEKTLIGIVGKYRYANREKGGQRGKFLKRKGKSEIGIILNKVRYSAECSGAAQGEEQWSQDGAEQNMTTSEKISWKA